MKIGQGFNLPLAIADDVIAIVGRRGRGKTTTAVVIVEELHKAGERFAVLDPIGVWYGLRSSRDGKGPGIPVVVMGGDHGDVPLEEGAGKVVAQFLAAHKASVVLDLSHFRKAPMVRFAADFLEELYHKNRAPLHVVLDEADRFAPQRVMGETARLVGAAEDVCKMGRAHGLHPILITQRPAGLNKNVLELAGLMVAHALTGPNDRKALDGWVKENADEDQRAAFTAALPGLKRGVAWFWQPDEDIFRQVAVRDRETYDSSATPTEGGQRKGPRVLAPVDLEALKARIADTIERQKADDPKELRRQLAEARGKLGQAERDLATVRAANVALASKPKGAPKPALAAAQLKRIDAALARLGKDTDRLEAACTALDSARDRLAQAQQVVVSELGLVRTAIERASGSEERGAVGAAGAPGWRAGRQAVPAAAIPAAPRAEPLAPRPDAVVEGMGKGEAAVLTAIAQHPEGATRDQVSLLAGYKRSTRDLYVQRLGRAGLVEQRGDRLVATRAGIESLGADFQPLPTGKALQVYWLARLPEGERSVFQAVLSAHPRPVSRDQLGDAAGYKRSTRDLYLQRLARRRLIHTDRGEVRAAAALFEGPAA